MKYKFIARSITDPFKEKGGLGYLTLEEAENHCVQMNLIRLDYDNNVNKIWDKSIWKSQPGEWKVFINE